MELKDFSKLDFWTKESQFNKYADINSRKQFGQYHEDAELTIAIPVYNRTTFLREAIDSALQQNTDRVYDIIVVDNASEDDAVQQIVSSFPYDRVIYFRNDENIGMAGNWNRCYELAKTKWVTLLHDDDRLKSNYVETVLAVIDKHGDSIGCLGTLHDDIDENGNILRGADGESGIVNSITAKDFYKQVTPIHIAGLIMNREKVIEIGGFDENFYPAHDSNLIAKIGIAYGGERLCENLCDYRIAENESFNHKTLYGFICYNHKHVNSLFEQHFVKLPYWLHLMHVNVILSNTENAIKYYWGQNLDYNDIRKFLGYRSANMVERIIHRIALKFV